ncbi:FxLYD domain-containing protein [Streptomyces cucumeris]|uniref:FxLYD domain-containing protein n=1 Tax=Streptomyces cucumeris TaxID=2962890 RepID=UPI003D70826C
MSGRLMRTICAVSLMAVLAPAAAGCSDEGGTPSSAVSRASAAVASATASAKAQLDKIEGGTKATRDVTAGPVSFSDQGRATTRLTVTNSARQTASYTILVNFRDADKHLVDAVVVTVRSVQPDTPTKATARSHRTLSGKVTAQVGTAVRY